MKEIVYLLQLLEQDVCQYDLHLLTLAWRTHSSPSALPAATATRRDAHFSAGRPNGRSAEALPPRRVVLGALWALAGP